jgi:hypothetical protein
MLHARFSFPGSLVAFLLACTLAYAGGPDAQESEPPVPVPVEAVPSAGTDRSLVLAGPPAVRPVASGLTDAQRPLGLATRDIPAPKDSSDAASAASLPQWAWQLGALALVIGSILAIGAVAKRIAPATGLMGALGVRGRAPSGVLEVLGRYPVSRGSMLVLLKLDRRVLLVSQQVGRGGTTMNTLTEITDPTEVASLVAKTSEGLPGSRQFERTLERVGGDAVVAAERPVPRQQPQARRKPKSAAADLDAAAAAQSLRSRLAAMQAVTPAAAPAAAVSTREYSA